MSVDVQGGVAPAAVSRGAKPKGEVIYRHKVAIRLTHWINALAMFFLLLSGLQIFNAHPALYWGAAGSDHQTNHVLLRIGAMPGHGQGATPRGVTQIGSLRLDTTGFLGVSKLHGQVVQRAWPAWLTVPSWQDLALGRRWHFFFAWMLALNGLAYGLWSFLSRHIQRDLWPTVPEVKSLPQSVVDHVQLKHPHGEAAKKYNILQKLSYCIVVLLLVPLMILTGLTMSPGFDAVLPGLLDLFGGRQSARTLHFVCASALVLFAFVHIVEVFLAGVVNEMRSMITGRYTVPPDPQAPAEAAR